MPSKIGQLSIGISADIASLKRDMAKANKTVKGGMDKMSTAAKNARKIIGGVALGLVAALSVGRLKGMIRETSEAIDAQAKFADVIGLTTEQMAGYGLAAQISGVEMGQFNTGITRLQKNIADAEAGLKTASREFDKLGLSAKELKLLSTDEQLKLIADRFQQLGSTVDKSSVLLNLFGRSGIALGKLLEQGAGSITKFQEEAERLGLSLSRLDAAQVEEANDALARASAVAEGLRLQLAVGVAPALKAIAELYLEAALAAGGFGSVSETVSNTVIEYFGAVGDKIEAISTFIDKANVKLAGFAVVMLKAQQGLANASPLSSVGSFFGGPSAEERNAQFAESIAAYEKLGRDSAAALVKAQIDELEEGRFSDRLKAKVEADLVELKARLKELSEKGGNGVVTTVPEGLSDAQKEQERQIKKIKSALESAQPPLKKYLDSVATATSLEQAGKISKEDLANVTTLYKQRLDEATGANEKWAKAVSDAAAFAEAAKTDIEKLNDELLRVQELSGKGLVNDEVVARTKERIEKDIEEIKEAAKEIDDIGAALAQGMQDVVSDGFVSIWKGGFDEVLAGFGDLLINLALEAAAADVVSALGFGGKDNKGGNLKSFAGALFSFEGGGYTGAGSRVGGLDGRGGFLSMVHPNETVVDHTKGQSMGGTTNNITFVASTNRQENDRALGQLQRRVTQTNAAGARMT